MDEQAETTEPTYTINEIFYSLQGEGMRAGEPSFFVRFSGCNQTCKVESHGFDCDTEFASGRKMTIPDIMAECQLLNPDCEWMVLTGGEPGLQVDLTFTDALHAGGYKLAMETNGSVNVDHLNLEFITVSPKVAEHAIRQLLADEVKYVRGFGQAIPRTVVRCDVAYISPAFNGTELDARALEWCIQLVKENPPWRLSLQLHKLLKIR